MYYLGTIESRINQENASEVFPIVLVSLPRMSYITSKSISVNYVRTVFRLRKSDQFTITHFSSICKSYHIGVPRTNGTSRTTCLNLRNKRFGLRNGFEDSENHLP